MIRISQIQDNFLHLIGWRQSYDVSDGTRLSENITTTESGLYYQDMHPLLTLQNLQSIAPDFKNTTYVDYDPEISYRKNDIV